MHLNILDGSAKIFGTPTPNVHEFFKIGFFHRFIFPSGERGRPEVGKRGPAGSDGRIHGDARQLIAGERTSARDVALLWS